MLLILHWCRDEAPRKSTRRQVVIQTVAFNIALEPPSNVASVRNEVGVRDRSIFGWCVAIEMKMAFKSAHSWVGLAPDLPLRRAPTR